MARSNPWTKKNPFMSMWLSNANALTGAARNMASAEMTRQMNEMTKATIENATKLAWGGWMLPPARPTARKRSTRRSSK